MLSKNQQRIIHFLGYHLNTYVSVKTIINATKISRQSAYINLRKLWALVIVTRVTLDRHGKLGMARFRFQLVPEYKHLVDMLLIGSESYSL